MARRRSHIADNAPRPPADAPDAVIACAALETLILDLTEGVLAADRRRLVEAHLLGCAACRSYIDDYRLTVTLVQSNGGADNAAAAAGAPEPLVAAILARLRRSDREPQG